MKRILMILAVATLASAPTSLEAQPAQPSLANLFRKVDTTTPKPGPSCPSTCAEVAKNTADSVLKHMKTPRLGSLEASRTKMLASLDSVGKRLAVLEGMKPASTDTAIKSEIVRLKGSYAWMNEQITNLEIKTNGQTGTLNSFKQQIDELNKSIAGLPKGTPTNSNPAAKSHWDRNWGWYTLGTAVVAGLVLNNNRQIFNGRGGGDINISNSTSVCIGGVCR